MVLVVKNSPANAGDIKKHELIPGLGRFPGENGDPLQYSCLENPMNSRASESTVHRVAKSWTQLKRLSTHVILLTYCWIFRKWSQKDKIISGHKREECSTLAKTVDRLKWEASPSIWRPIFYFSFTFFFFLMNQHVGTQLRWWYV